jgi:hypothetical protein
LAFFQPTQRKVKVAALIFAGSVTVLIVSRFIPPELDILDLRDLIGQLMGIIFGWPIRLFDFITGSAFAPKECFTLCFPALVQVVVAFIADSLLFYLVACFYCERLRPKN